MFNRKIWVIVFCFVGSVLIVLDNFLKTGVPFEYWQLIDVKIHHEHLALLFSLIGVFFWKRSFLK